MIKLTDKQIDRLKTAEESLRKWNPLITGPQAIANSLSTLHGGAPTLLYNISDNGTGTQLVGALCSLPLSNVLMTPFVRGELVFSPEFTTVTEAESTWGAENRAVCREDLRQDDFRWKTFQRTFLTPTATGDFLRISLRGSRNEFLGMAGSFATGSSTFHETDRPLLDAFSIHLRRLLEITRFLGLGFGPQHPTVAMALAWPSPAFVVTDRSELIAANKAARILGLQRPAWLESALADPLEIPTTWACATIETHFGRVFVFTQHRTSQEEWLIRSALEDLEIPKYLQDIGILLVKGLTYEEIARISGKSVAVVSTYVSRIRGIAGMSSRAELVYEIMNRIQAEEPVWPIAMRATTQRR